MAIVDQAIADAVREAVKVCVLVCVRVGALDACVVCVSESLFICVVYVVCVCKGCMGGAWSIIR